MSDSRLPDESGLGTFIPHEWLKQAQDRMLDSMREQTRMWDKFAGIDPDNRPTVMEQRDLTPEYLSARKKFKRRWKKLVKDGLAAGYLEHDHCYECGGELKVTKETTEWVSIPNPDYDPDKPNPYKDYEGGTVTFIPTTKRIPS